MIHELDLVALTCDLPGEKLRLGDIGTVVLLHGRAAFEVEFKRSRDKHPTVVTVKKAQIRLIGADEIAEGERRNAGFAR
jgi:hypothetical protein